MKKLSGQGRVAWAALTLCAGLALILSSCDIVESPTKATWSDSNGYVEFFTNSGDDYGYSFFQTVDGAPDGVYPVRGTVRKVSGSASNGSGLVWGFQDIDDFYAVLLTTDRYYSVIKCVKGAMITIQDWTRTPSLKSGLSSSNTVELRYASGYFSLYLNDCLLKSFSSDYTLGTAGKAGFIAGVGAKEDEHFPVAPVKVLFTMSSPATAP